MNSLLFSYFPNQNYTEELCEIVTIQPQCTLIEKILLLHEEYNRKERAKMRTDRMSRHYYDLYQLSKQGFSNSTLNDVEFIEKIIAHRKYYSRLKRFDYTTLQIGSFKIIPDNAVLLKLAQDYDIMRTEMIYGNPPSFEEVIEAIKYIQTIINTMK